MTNRERLARIDALHAAVQHKFDAILKQRRLKGRDAARAITLRMALHRIDRLMPFHRQRALP